MKLTIPPISAIVSVISTLGGSVGVICGIFNVPNLSTPIQALLTAVSGVLVAIPVHHAAKTTAQRALSADYVKSKAA
jgi:hypothetical protein